MSVGMPAGLYLAQFGQIVWETFGEMSYHVGSSLKGKEWRDVDVRLILPDDVWESLKLGNPTGDHTNPKWRGLVLAFSALGREMTGLPVDFQIQQQSNANKLYPTHEDHPRSALCILSEPK